MSRVQLPPNLEFGTSLGEMGAEARSYREAMYRPTWFVTGNVHELSARLDYAYIMCQGEAWSPRDGGSVYQIQVPRAQHCKATPLHRSDEEQTQGGCP